MERGYWQTFARIALIPSYGAESGRNERYPLLIHEREYSFGVTDPWTTVSVVGSRVEAELAAGMLKSHGVHAIVLADDEGGMNIALQPGRVRVLVAESDLADATEILGTARIGRLPTKKPNRIQRFIWRLLGGEIH